MDKYEQLYIEYLYYFNVRRDYFECHEVLEELWLEQRRSPLYQGLLQVAVGLYHYRNDNIRGAVKLFSAAIEKLNNYPDHSLGIRLDKLIEASGNYLIKLKQIERAPFDFYDLDIEIWDSSLKAQVEQLSLYPPEKREE